MKQETNSLTLSKIAKLADENNTYILAGSIPEKEEAQKSLIQAIYLIKMVK